MNKKKKPERTCIACNTKQEKNDLLRIVRTTEGTIEVDVTGKKNGKGSYICKKEECLNKLIKIKKLERIFEMQINPKIYEEIEKVIK